MTAQPAQFVAPTDTDSQNNGTDNASNPNELAELKAELAESRKAQGELQSRIDGQSRVLGKIQNDLPAILTKLDEVAASKAQAEPSGNSGEPAGTVKPQVIDKAAQEQAALLKRIEDREAKQASRAKREALKTALIDTKQADAELVGMAVDAFLHSNPNAVNVQENATTGEYDVTVNGDNDSLFATDAWASAFMNTPAGMAISNTRKTPSTSGIPTGGVSQEGMMTYTAEDMKRLTPELQKAIKDGRAVMVE